MSDWNKKVIEEFRANKGKVSGHFDNHTLLLLHTTGNKSGKERVNPLVTFENGDGLVIVASNGGSTSAPAWYHNLMAKPVVGVEYGAETFQAQARVTSEPERTELDGKMEERMAAFSKYKETAGRVIPVISLERLP